MSGLTFRERLAKEISNGRSPEDAYYAAAKAVVKDELIRHFAPVGIDEAYHIRRMSSRNAENRAFGGWGGKLTPVEQDERPPMNIREMLADKHFHGTEGYVTWEAATIEDHEARIEAQESLAARIHLDAERHRQAVKVLRENDAETLGDVDDWSALVMDEDQIE